MEKISNMPLLDENENSPIPEPRKAEKKELSLPSTTPGAENIAPQVILEGITSPKSNISENNCNNETQNKNILNTLASEIEVGGPVSDIHDASNGSFLGDAGVSLKSSNGSFSGEANSSFFKSLNGSYVVKNNSPKTTAVDGMSKAQSPLKLPNLNTNLGESFDEGKSRDASFTKPTAESMVISPVLPSSEDSTQSAFDTFAPREFVTNESSILSSPMVNDCISMGSSSPRIENIIESNVHNDTFGDALAAFSSLKINDTPARPTKSSEALKEAALVEFFMVQDDDASETASHRDTAASETASHQETAASETASRQDTAASETASRQDTAASETASRQDTAASETVSRQDNEAEKTVDMPAKVPEDSMIGNETLNLVAAKTVESPLKTCSSTSVPETNICAEPIDFKSTEASPLRNPGEVLEATGHAMSEDTIDIQPIENVASPVKSEAKEIISEDLDDMFSNPLKTGSSINVSQTNICSEPIDFKSSEASLSSNKSPGNVLEDAVEVKPIENVGDSDSVAKSFEERSPVDDFIFKVPGNPTITTSTEDAFQVPADEEFTDAVQFFNDPASLHFLENIVTSSSKEDNVPRSSLYIKFDPYYSAFPRNPDMVQASENDGDKRQSLGATARESLGNILISFDSPRKSGGQAAAPVIVAPAKVYTEEELQQLLNVNELTNQEILLKKQREMEEDLARREKTLLAQVEAKDARITVLEKNIRGLKCVLDELADASLAFKTKQEDKLKKLKDLEDLNTKLKGEVETLTEDLQSVETTFSDFHKRYETSKAMLKSYKENEEILKTRFTEQQQAYQKLQDSTREELEKASAEVASVKKTSAAQIAVLKAQLKKAEMKASGLESDMRQMKIENAELGDICDDLMEKVGKS